MILRDKDKFTIQDSKGVTKTFYKLLRFTSSLTNKEYLIYTDNLYEDKKLNIYSNILKEENGEIIFEEVKEKEDIMEVENALIKAKLEN